MVFIGLTAFAHILAFLLLIRPDWVAKPIQNIVPKYAHSNLSNINTHQLTNKLKRLMVEQKSYLNPDLNLEKLAGNLNIKPHQLSEFLNDKNQQTFNDFINSYRVEEAKKLLTNMKKNRLTVETIAYEVGFNSVATFYRNFKKNMNCSPTDWLKEQ